MTQPQEISIHSSASALPAASRSQHRFSVQIAGTLAARLLMAGASVVAGVIVARWLGAEGLGTLAVINVAVATVVQLGSVGLPSASTYFISRDRSRLAATAVTSLGFAFIGGSALALATVALAAWQPQVFSSIPLNLVTVAAISIPFQLVILIALNIFLAVGDVQRFNLVDVSIQVFVLVNAVVALVLLGRGVETLITLNTAVTIAAALIVLLLILRLVKRHTERSTLRPGASLLASMLRYGMKFHIGILAGALIVRADLLVVNHFRGTAEAGVYSVASQVALLLMLLPGVIATLLFPRVTAEQDASGDTTSLVARHTALVMFSICLLAAPAGFILPWLYGNAFFDVPIQLLILLPGVFLIGLESVLVQHFNALGLPRAIPLFWVLTLLVNLVLVFVLVPRFGARGAAAASTLSYLLIFFLVAVYFRAKTDRPFSDTFLPRGDELRSLFALRNWTTPARSLRG
ncbi:MAG: polysaccharide biosynthesis C-terminal domain-containing protein [Acidobacteriota bacterium]|nr:polysaccharide biosynthesis C-terminal domain-containing protein [Acidobacteriota bacterium]